jgi:S1-C subfamily serine protease
MKLYGPSVTICTNHLVPTAFASANPLQLPGSCLTIRAMRRDGPFGHYRSMEHRLSNFSASLADLVERAGHVAVGIDGRRRIGSSGFLWKPNVIVTAEHAIRREDEVSVILADGKRTSAEIAGRDTSTDIAVLRVNDTSAPPLSPSPALRTGELVVAVGRHEPGVLAVTGIVSTSAGPWKTWRGGHVDSLLRLDIGAYPRSSGSMVIDAHGRFAGMLTTGLTRTAPVAIPAATIDRIAGELLEHGRIARGYLGIGLQPIALPPTFDKVLNRNQRAGVIVLSAEPGGPADSAGILPGDVVVEIAGQPIADTDDVQSALRGSIGKELPVVIVRGGQRTEINVKVGERRN